MNHSESLNYEERNQNRKLFFQWKWISKKYFSRGVAPHKTVPTSKAMIQIIVANENLFMCLHFKRNRNNGQIEKKPKS